MVNIKKIAIQWCVYQLNGIIHHPLKYYHSMVGDYYFFWKLIIGWIQITIDLCIYVKIHFISLIVSICHSMVTDNHLNLKNSQVVTNRLHLNIFWSDIFSSVKHIQLKSDETAQILNKPYVNEVTLRGQQQPVKCC